jgi:CBS domain-containing protein
MNATLIENPTLQLCAETAADLMMANPISVREDANVREALVLFTDKGFSAAPVIDAAGRPVGVLSRFDLLVHDREKVDYLRPRPEFFYEQEFKNKKGEPVPGFEVEDVDQTCVRDLMTPAVFSVSPDTSVEKVIHEMLSLRVHHLFVVGKDGVLVGVISPLDVLRHLKP